MRHLGPPEPQPPTGGVPITPDQRMPPYCAVGALLGAPAPSLIRWTELSRLDGRVVARASYLPAPGGAPLTYCVKYGPDDRLGHEAALYAALFSPPGRDPVAGYVGYEWSGGHHALLLEWIDGMAPDFGRAAHVAGVFAALGAWLATAGAPVSGAATPRQAEWRSAVPSQLASAWEHFLTDVRDHRWHEVRMMTMVERALRNPVMLADLGAPDLLPLYGRLAGSASRLARRIAAAPLTVDPGDLTADNVLLRPDGAVRFLDFEYAAIAPVSTVLENLDEPYEGAPRGSLAGVALRAFFQSWTCAGGPRMEWNDFLDAWHCARCLKKLADIDDYIVCFLESGRDAEGMEQARAYASTAPPVIHRALDAL